MAKYNINTIRASFESSLQELFNAMPDLENDVKETMVLNGLLAHTVAAFYLELINIGIKPSHALELTLDWSREIYGNLPSRSDDERQVSAST